MNFFFNYKDSVKPEKGDLLISEPFLPDPNFERTVVLLCEHNQEGSFGFVLNKISELKFDEVIEDAENFNEKLYVGGPVQQDTLHFIHRTSDLLEGGIDIGNEIIWGGNFEQLLLFINSGQIEKEDFKFFLGYSGWSGGQLEAELKENSWIIYKHATAVQVFDTDPNQLWKEILSEMGGRYRMFANYPVDPRLN